MLGNVIDRDNLGIPGNHYSWNRYAPYLMMTSYAVNAIQVALAKVKVRVSLSKGTYILTKK